MAGAFRYVRTKTKRDRGGRTLWAEDIKLKAVDLYVKTGSPSSVCRELNLPKETFNTWSKKDWFREMLQVKRTEHHEQLDVKLTESIDTAIEQLQDRLVNGDTVYNQRTGKFTQAPAKLRDLNSAFNSLIEKRNLLRNLPTKITEQHSTASQLQALADQFQQFVTGKVKTEQFDELVDKVIEGETVEQGEDGNWYVKS